MRGASALFFSSSSLSLRASQDLPLPGRPLMMTAILLGRLCRPGAQNRSAVSRTTAMWWAIGGEGPPAGGTWWW